MSDNGGRGKTCRMPMVSLVAFEDRSGKFIFVRIPDSYGRYVRTDPCVAHVPCSRCNATIGEPCMHNGKYCGGTHAVRRGAWDQRHRGKAQPFRRKDVTDPADGATVTIKASAA